MDEPKLTLVLDIGKSHAKVLFVTAAGEVLERHGRDNHSVISPLGYPALDIEGLTDWVRDTLAASPCTARCSDAIATTHGAALVALDAHGGLAWSPVDYEHEELGRTLLDADAARFRDTLSPDLPSGLNAARQLAWMQDRHPDAFARTHTLMPYPQYWAWWLSGGAASERSSLGCHTHLWCPATAAYSRLAQARGWADRFAPLRRADEVLGPVLPHRAQDTGLPADCRVHVGAHDSNACLARHLKRWTHTTVVSSGTWTVIMAPGAAAATLDPELDMLGNVNVLGELTPTARFMGGREHAALCAGAPPDAARLEVLERLLRERLLVLPAYSTLGGPFRGHTGELHFQGQALGLGDLVDLSAAARATLAALYSAQITAWLVTRLRPLHITGSVSPAEGLDDQAVVVEGPLAHNPVFLRILASLLPGRAVHASKDDLEGTARGAWMLAHWDAAGAPLAGPALEAIEALPAPAALIEMHTRWCQAVASRLNA